MEKWHEFLASSKAEKLVANCSLKLDSDHNMSNKKDVDSLDICESDTGERDEWMYFAELNINTTFHINR